MWQPPRPVQTRQPPTATPTARKEEEVREGTPSRAHPVFWGGGLRPPHQPIPARSLTTYTDTLEARSTATIRCLGIIGEAANRTSPEFRAAYPDIPWRLMTDMRNRLIHG
jgi:hypothetical protein